MSGTPERDDYVLMPADPCTRVVLADRAGAARAALARLIHDLAGAALVADVENAADARRAIEAGAADILVIDDRLLRDTQWTAAELGVRLIVVGLDDDPGFRARAERLGAECWVAKERADAVLPALLPAGPRVSRLC